MNLGTVASKSPWIGRSRIAVPVLVDTGSKRWAPCRLPWTVSTAPDLVHSCPRCVPADPTPDPTSLSTRVPEPALRDGLAALATALEAGLPLSAAADSTFSASLPRPLAAAVEKAAADGRPLSEPLAASGLFLPHDIALLQASEQRGRPDEGLRVLSENVARRVDGRRALLAGMAYPLLLIALSGVILPLPMVVTCGVAGYAARAIWLPLLVGAGVFIFAWWLPGLPVTDPRRRWPGKVLTRLPGARGAVRVRDRARFARVLGRSLEAGLGVDPCLTAACAAVDDPAIRRMRAPTLARLRHGATLAEALAQRDPRGADGDLRTSSPFDPAFIAVVAQGEVTGTLPTGLDRLATDLEQRADRALRRTVLVLLGVVYAGVVLYIGWSIISGFVGVVDTIDAALEF